jgi:hypothetical protein
MMSRCTNPNSAGYVNYGRRGITVDPAWHHFENFAMDMWPKPDGLFSLERKDNSLGYSKANCEWATRSEQCFNRRVFSNSTTGYAGVIDVTHGGGVSRFRARLDFEHVRYNIGLFDTADAAADAREKFIDLFFTDRDAAELSVASETLWCTSKTGVRGVSHHADGRGFIVRATKNGKRHYLGYYTNFKDAVDARTRFIEAAA